MTQKVISRDGTAIAFERVGTGPALILVDGALCYRGMGPMAPIAKLLAPRFTVHTYDRRGRGESGDMPPYAVAREVEDLEALIGAAGGTAFLFGISSGAVLALEAATALGSKVRGVVTYEAPFIVDDSRAPLADDYATRMESLLAADRRADAVKHFMRAVGLNGVMIFLMQFMPAWSKLERVAHTLPHDVALTFENQRGRPLVAGRWSALDVPMHVIDGGKSPAWMRHGNEALARALPRAQYRTLPGQTHMLKASAIAPVLVELLLGADADGRIAAA